MKEIAAAIGRIKGDGSSLPLLHQGTLSDAKAEIQALKETPGTPWYQNLAL